MGFDTDRDLGWSRTQGPEGGAYSALPIWARFIKITEEGKPAAPLPIPEGLGKCTNAGITDWCISGGTSISETGVEEPVEENGEGTTTDNNSEDSSSQTEVDTSNISSDNIF